jgi:uncharacterized protein YacL
MTLQPQTLEIIKIALFLFGTYLGAIMTLRASDELYISIPFVKFAPMVQKKKDLLLDQSVLADARIIDVAATGIFDHQLVVPRFILKSSMHSRKREMRSQKRKRAAHSMY